METRGTLAQGWRGSAYQLEEVLPVVLGHEAEEGQEGPAEGVIAGVAIVGVPPGLHALVALRALPAKGAAGMRPWHGPTAKPIPVERGCSGGDTPLKGETGGMPGLAASAPV